MTPETQPTTFRFRADEIERLKELQREMGLRSQSAVIRRALQQLEFSRQATRTFIEDLKNRFGDDAYVAIELDEMLNAFVRVDGVPHEDLYAPTLPIRFEDWDDDFVEVFLGDPHPRSTVRIFIGVIPLRAGVPISFPLRELDVDMKPRAVAFPVGD